MPSQPIPTSLADSLINEYSSFMGKLGVNMGHQTESVSFDGATVMHWLNAVMPFADELRISMGCYPAGHPNAGRTTVILSPYLNGARATDGGGHTLDSFNDGQGMP